VRNVKKETKKVLEYENFTTQIQHTWKEKKSNTRNNRGNWNHLKSFRKYLSHVPGKHEITELQKTAILGTAHILRNVLI
jgi:UDP-N-acetylglucosamine pyrophosphorylase